MNFEIDDAETVETVEQLISTVRVFRDAVYTDLATSYRVERLRERLTDGSFVYSIRIREAAQP